MIFFVFIHGAKCAAVVGTAYRALQYITVSLTGRPENIAFISHDSLTSYFYDYNRKSCDVDIFLSDNFVYLGRFPSAQYKFWVVK
jgi:hypothetical protein